MVRTVLWKGRSILITSLYPIAAVISASAAINFNYGIARISKQKTASQLNPVTSVIEQLDMHQAFEVIKHFENF